MNRPNVPLDLLRTTGRESPNIQAQRSERFSVLCVDDEDDTRAAVRGALSGHELTFASTAYEALRTLNARAFDLYIVDYWQPDWSGTGLCREIRKVDPNVPICICTAADRPDLEQRARRAGANNCLSKPLEPEVLGRELARLLEFRAVRGMAAHEQAVCAVRHELDKRFGRGYHAASAEQYQKALRRVARTKARDAYIAAGGTLSGFDSIWEPTWHESLNAH